MIATEIKLKAIWEGSLNFNVSFKHVHKRDLN